ncbi:MAG: ComEC/Rec2 family competence protein [Pseudomonadota bacterium]
MPLLAWISATLDRQRGVLFHWVPVLLAAGIGAYFALPTEPSAAQYSLIAAGIAGLSGAAWRAGAQAAPVFVALALIGTGLCLAGARAHGVAAPVLEFRYYGPVTGRIVKVDRSASQKPRVTLDQVVLERTAPDRTPERVRLSLHGEQGYVALQPGLTLMVTAHLSPPPGPAEPGGFDFRRMAWFDRLGAVGYARSPALTLAPAEAGARGLAIARLRAAISRGVQSLMPGEAGAFAAAITTGDRSAMAPETIEALRKSNLAHVLAISGLHMGLLTGFVFAALRVAMAAIPYAALRWPTKKIAAVAAIGAGFFYYLLSGGIVATERAMIMITVMFVAILCDRRAISLRSVAIAATLVLALRPESLTEPGFQMSFAATTALVAAFAVLREYDRSWLPRWARPVLALVVSSTVAGAATAPIAAAHFNRIADYGLIANLIAVPAMGLLVMPAAVLAALLWPLGLSFMGLALMKPGVEWILGIAHWVAALPGSVTPVVAPGTAVLPALALGGLWLVLWQGRARWIGVLPMVLGLALWMQTERPVLLVAESGGLVGVMTEGGRALNKPRGDGFVALSWLENDGDSADQEGAHARPGAADGLIDLGGLPIIHLSGRGAIDRVEESCRSASLVIIAKPAQSDAPCLLVDAERLRDTGALAVTLEAGVLKLSGARDAARRLWSP